MSSVDFAGGQRLTNVLIQLHLLDVIGNPWIEKFPQRTFGGNGFADRGGGNWLTHTIEQMQGSPFQNQIALGSLFGKRLPRAIWF